VIDQTQNIEETFLKRTREEETIPEELPKKILKIENTQESSQEDPMEENLRCAICSDIFYKCISVIPCLHNFCAPCYSGWMKSQNLNETCPQCRQPVTEVRKNHGIQNFVDTYLKLNPKKQKTKEEIEELEKENTFTDEFVN
jgi:E3 ubiquitin-protein ligase CHFR